MPDFSRLCRCLTRVRDGNGGAHGIEHLADCLDNQFGLAALDVVRAFSASIHRPRVERATISLCIATHSRCRPSATSGVTPGTDILPAVSAVTGSGPKGFTSRFASAKNAGR